MQATPGNSGTPVPVNADKPQAGSVTPSQPAEDPTPDNWYNKSQIINGNRQNLYVDPAGTPQEQHAIAIAKLSGNQQLIDEATAKRDNGVKSRLAASQSKASGMYDTITKGVLDAPDGRKMDALDAISPGIAKKIRSMIPDKVEEEEAAESYAKFVANDMHQYSGRKVEKGEDGVYRDAETLRPLDVPRVGMSPGQIADLSTKLFTPSIQVPDGRGGTTLKSPFEAMRDKDPSLTPQTALAKAADRLGVPGASPTITGAPRAEFQSMVGNAVNKISNSQPAPGALNAGANKAAVVNAAVAKDPKLADALKDPDFDIKLPAAKPYTTPDTDTQGQLDDIRDSRKELYAESRDTVKTAAQSNQYLQAARDIIDSKGVTLGKYGGLVAKASALSPFTGDASNYAEVAKYLAQAALQNSKQGFGAHFTEKEFDTMRTQMNANQDMPVDAIRAITDTAMRANQYALDSAKRAVIYNSIPSKDPRTFAEWNETHYPREEAVNGTKAAAKPMPDAAKLKAYADKGFGGDIAAATAHLKANGYK
jgi:hypothetical protein